MRMLTLGRVYMDTQRYSEAKEMFKKVLTEKGGTVKPVFDALAQYYLGNVYDLLKDRNFAIVEYKKVIKSGVAYENLQKRAKKHILKPYAVK